MPYQNDLTEKQIEAIKLIRNHVVHMGSSPSVRKLMSLLGYKSVKATQDILRVLAEKRIIQKNEDGSYKLISDPDLGPSHAQTTNIPIVGFVACGSPILAMENVEAYIPISTSLAKNGGIYFLLHAKGDSMNLASINDGDLVLVRQQSTANNGDRVVALIDDEATIKAFHKEGGVVVLKPKSSNPIHKPIVLENNFQIQGVVVASFPNV